MKECRAWLVSSEAEFLQFCKVGISLVNKDFFYPFSFISATELKAHWQVLVYHRHRYCQS